MSNWFKKLFGAEKCCENCCQKEEKAQPSMNQPMAETKPEANQPSDVEKAL